MRVDIMIIPCYDERYFFTLHIIGELADFDAKVSPHYKINPETGTPIPGCCGDVYFKPDSFKTGVIAHESLHMALAYLRMIDEPIWVSDDCDKVEETIAFHTGWFAARIGEIYWNLIDQHNQQEQQ